jgi:hypothetical protein
MLIILPTHEEEIRRIMIQSQPRQIVPETLSRKTLNKNRAGGVAQGEGLEFKPQYLKKKKKEISYSSMSGRGHGHVGGGHL